VLAERVPPVELGAQHQRVAGGARLVGEERRVQRHVDAGARRAAWLSAPGSPTAT
jgi:hypothetical protein